MHNTSKERIRMLIGGMGDDEFERARSQGSNPWQTQVMALGVPLPEHFPLDLVS